MLATAQPRFFRRPRATPDNASGNTDNPENKQNPTTQPPAPIK